MIVNGSTVKLVSCGVPSRVTAEKSPIVGAPAGSKSSVPALTSRSAWAGAATIAASKSAARERPRRSASY